MPEGKNPSTSEVGNLSIKLEKTPTDIAKSGSPCISEPRKAELKQAVSLPVSHSVLESNSPQEKPGTLNPVPVARTLTPAIAPECAEPEADEVDSFSQSPQQEPARLESWARETSLNDYGL